MEITAVFEVSITSAIEEHLVESLHNHSFDGLTDAIERELRAAATLAIQREGYPALMVSVRITNDNR